jgi:AraC-like DNA-binding protein
MKLIFSTAVVHPRDRFAYWHDVACKEIIGHEAKPRVRSQFEASLHAATLSVMDLITFDNSPMDAAVTRRNIERTSDDCLLICRQMKGEVLLEQDSRQERLAAGEFAILDPRHPYTAVFAASRMLLIKVPRRILEQRCGRVRELSARVVTRDNHIGAITSDFLALLARHVGALDGSAAATSSAYALDLIALSLLRLKGDQRPSRSSARSLALSNMRAFIESRLGDPELDPAAVAAGTGISLRYAQALMADAGTSLSRYIQARRLSRCAQALTDPAQSRRAVGEIAFAWGFTDAAHFGRLFKKRFGMTPRDYRQSQLGCD